MKLSPFSTRCSVLGLAVALATTLTAHAGSNSTEQTTTVHGGKKEKAAVAAGAPTTPSTAVVELLDHAYGDLKIADHDYKGHRAHAMHDIESAAKELGQKLGGHGKGDETQKTSDSHLQTAEGLLQQALGGLTGKPHRHVEEALKQLTIALNVK